MTRKRDFTTIYKLLSYKNFTLPYNFILLLMHGLVTGEHR